MNEVAMIGAGLSGLTCSRALVDAGCKVVVFEKSRGFGGRIATCRTAANVSDVVTADHGAQYFTVRDDVFSQVVGRWHQQGVVALWQGKIGVSQGGTLVDSESIVERWVGTPTMSAIGRFHAQGLDVRLQTRITRIERRDECWELFDEQQRSMGRFATLLSSVPPAQSAELLEGSCGAGDELNLGRLLDKVQQAKMLPCWAVVAVFGERLPLPYDGLFVHHSPLSWVARDSSKPARNGPETWVLHASGDWSSENLDLPPEAVADRLFPAFWHATGVSPRQPTTVIAHRWRFALPVEPLSERHVFDASLSLGCCGDWCGGPRVEGAYLSGLSIAKAVLMAR